MNLEIRLLNSGDAQSYRELRLEALKKHPEAFSASYEEENSFTVDTFKERLGTAKTFGAFRGEILTGVVTLVQENKMKIRHLANIVGVYVKEEERGKGTAKSLLKAAILHAEKNTEIEKLYLAVESENIPAIKLYTSSGFSEYALDRKVLKIGENYYDEKLMCLYIEKE